MGIHNHQPVGNFGWVIEKINEEAYRPFYEMLSEFPRIKFSLHMSGSLCEWYEENDTATLKLIRQMVKRGQVEILSSGFYEPVLASIPRRDRKGQILKFQDYLEKSFGSRPKGLWLTERVWEPALVEDLAESGIEYVLVDDRLFLVTGFKREDLNRYYVTESSGAYLKVFPIDMKTRAYIPFRSHHDIELYLRDVDRRGGPGVFYFDDGEKFGAWPGTADSVYKQKWLENFLILLSRLEKEFVQCATYSEAIKSIAPSGIVYLPTGSYAEMEDWTLPPDSYRQLKAKRTEVDREFSEPAWYLRGGIWKNFFAKYPETNAMHKFMMRVSDEVESRKAKFKSPQREELLTHLYRSQCNDAYWHGVFGGLYLPHLRHGLWVELCEAKAMLNASLSSKVEVVHEPWLSSPSIHFDSPFISAQWEAGEGGVLSRFMSLERDVNALNTLARHPEGYHDKLREVMANLHHGSFSPLTEGRSQVATQDRAQLEGADFIYDKAGRHAFMDCIFDSGALNQEAFEQRVLLKPLNSRLAAVPKKASDKSIDIEYPFLHMKVKKRIVFIPEEGFRVEYRIENIRRDMGSWCLGTEINFHLPSPKLKEQTARKISFLDDATKTVMSLTCDRDSRFLQYPVETFHQSESGINKTYQGTCVMPVIDIDTANPVFSFAFELKLV